MNKLKIEFDSNTGYLTHNYHPYPCKFVPQIPNQIIAQYSKEGDTILDPFVGSGTTLAEASLLNRNGIGIDLNPVAVLSTKVKTSVLNNNDKKLVFDILKKIEFKSTKDYNNFLKENFDKNNIPKWNNLDHWFLPFVIKELSALKNIISKTSNTKVKNFLLLGFSNVIIPISNQDSETRYVAVSKPIKKMDLFVLFSKKINSMLNRNDDYALQRSNSKIKVYHDDARKMNQVKDKSVNLIITSPPYLNTFDYYLYHKSRIHWLGFEPSEVRKSEIGCHHTANKFDIGYPKYVNALSSIFSEFNRVLTDNGHIFIVIGDAVLENIRVNSLSVVRELAKENNFQIISVTDQKLKTSTRSFNAKFSASGKNEYMIMLTKQ
jgi:site-specific DNA-methyltransferase (cytosine-N4-specific)